jgi:hypothetical protein
MEKSKARANSGLGPGGAVLGEWYIIFGSCTQMSPGGVQGQ